MMKIYTKCSNCTKEISIWKSVSDRVELARVYGDEIGVTCDHCHATRDYPVDEFRAKPSKLAQLIALLIAVVGGPIVFYYGVIYLPGTLGYYVFGSYLLIPSVVYVLIRKQDQERVNSFNRHRFKQGKRS